MSRWKRFKRRLGTRLLEFPRSPNRENAVIVIPVHKKLLSDPSDVHVVSNMVANDVAAKARELVHKRMVG